MLNFVDDPLAIGLANVLQAWGKVNILGIMSSVSSRYAPPAIDAINTFYGHGNIPIAIQKPVDNSTIDPNYPKYPEYLTGLTFLFPEDIRDGANTTDPVTLYRRHLADAADKSITLIIIGFFDNLYHLSLSKPDDISPLGGMQLLRQKVTELIVQGDDVGKSFNFVGHNGTFATVLNEWKGRMMFVPDAIGDSVFVGKRLTSETSMGNPVAYAFKTGIGLNENHQSWDIVAMYYAICGVRPAFTTTHERGHVQVAPDGSTTWNESRTPNLQNSLSLQINNATFARNLESMLIWEPGQPFPSHDACIVGF
ncbi:hypothetical protein B0J14DRAFT_557560 [Halenospora varia]|nr:hypothetical protein B0J14DRAFT_557560 [Halenospora varia]